MNYQIEDIETLIAKLEQDKGLPFADIEPADQLEENLAIVYKLSDGQAIVMPQFGQKGLLFLNLDDCYQEVQHKIPLEEEAPNAYQLDQERLLKVEENISYYVDSLSKALSMSLDLNGSRQQVESINKGIRKYGIAKFSDAYFIAFGVFIAELLRRKVNGRWLLKKEYGINPYYIPYVVDEQNQELYTWAGIVKYFYKHYGYVKFDTMKIIEFSFKAGPFDEKQKLLDNLFKDE